MKAQEVIDIFNLTIDLLELHEENPFKIKALKSAVFALEKIPTVEGNWDLKIVESTPGIGKGIITRIHELTETGKLSELIELEKLTPASLIELFSVKGLGPKKIRQLWKELGVESIDDLFSACHENKLIGIKGFGLKTQQKIKEALEFKQLSQGQFHYAKAIKWANSLMEKIIHIYQPVKVAITGDLRRNMPVVDKIELLVVLDDTIQIDLEKLLTELDQLKCLVQIHRCSVAQFFAQLFFTTGPAQYVAQFDGTENSFDSEEALFEWNKKPFVPAYLRDNDAFIKAKEIGNTTDISELSWDFLKGALHNHSTYSDGQHSLKEMAQGCIDLGLTYFGICDHSQAAFYANGLKPERIIEQHHEIDQLNKELSPFVILKGIECDILADGRLDYNDEILRTFDFVVASVHTQLEMDQEKATNRLIRAIENPFTTILGHMTGRLLLHRKGYLLDHKKVIDACAANEVCIELNANPYRLDIDWKWIPYCLEKGVKIAINPDAHAVKGLNDMHYGISVALKANLPVQDCLNCLTASEIMHYFESRKLRRWQS